MNLVTEFIPSPAIYEVAKVQMKLTNVSRTRRLNDKTLSDRIDTQVASREKILLKYEFNSLKNLRNARLDSGAEENLTSQATYCNYGIGLNIETGVFLCPLGRDLHVPTFVLAKSEPLFPVC